MAKAKVIDIAILSPISTIERTNETNTVNGKAVADYVQNNGGGSGGSITIDDTVTATGTNAVSGKAVVNYINNQNFASATTLSNHTSSSAVHFTGTQKTQFEAIIKNYDGSTSISKLVSDINELKNSGGGTATLPNNIECQSIKVTGNYINWTTWTSSNLDLGSHATISSDTQDGNVNLGYNSIISGGAQNSNVNLGSESKISKGTQDGNVNLGSESIISGGSQRGNINLGINSTISGGHQEGNINLGYYSTISGGEQDSNVFAGTGFTISGTCTTTYNTWIIAGLHDNTNFESQVTKRYGLTLIGNAGSCGSYAGSNYRVYWPNVSGYDAQIHGNTQWADDHNIKDADGNLIVQNGKLIASGNSSSSGLPEPPFYLSNNVYVTNGNHEIGAGKTYDIVLGLGGINGGDQYNTIIGDHYFRFSGGNQYGNTIGGCFSSVLPEVTTRNTCIFAGVTEPYNPIERRGLTLIGNGDETSILNAYSNYQVFWPSSESLAAETHGYVKCQSDYNLIDSNGDYIIQNGKLAHPQIVICESESELPAANQQKDGILYIVLEA